MLANNVNSFVVKFTREPVAPKYKIYIRIVIVQQQRVHQESGHCMCTGTLFSGPLFTYQSGGGSEWPCKHLHTIKIMSLNSGIWLIELPSTLWLPLITSQVMHNYVFAHCSCLLSQLKWLVGADKIITNDNDLAICTLLVSTHRVLLFCDTPLLSRVHLHMPRTT